MWSSDSDLELLHMLSDWSDLSSDEDSSDAFRPFGRTINRKPVPNKNAPDDPDDVSMYDEDDAPILSRNSQSKDEDSLFNEYQCNACNNTITEFRYTCVQCSDLDLCGACEANKAHHHHYVIRVPEPRPFAEVQLVLATIRRHLMKRLDPITEPEQDREDVISVKSEVKIEYESNDDFGDYYEDSNNGDDENSCGDDNLDNDANIDHDDNIDNDDNIANHDEHNDDNGNNDNDNINKNTINLHLDIHTSSENTTNKLEKTAPSASETLTAREYSVSVVIKEEPEGDDLLERLPATPDMSTADNTGASIVTSTVTTTTTGAHTLAASSIGSRTSTSSVASAVVTTEMSAGASTAAIPGANDVVLSPPTAPFPAKRKILIRRADIINVKDFSSPAKIMCVPPVSSCEMIDKEETVTLLFPDDQPPQLQPPETGQEYKDIILCGDDGIFKCTTIKAASENYILYLLDAQNR